MLTLQPQAKQFFAAVNFHVHLRQHKLNDLKFKHHLRRCHPSDASAVPV